MVCAVPSHWTSSPSDSATNRRGRRVLPYEMTGTTAGLVSMLTDFPSISAAFFPIHRFNVLPFLTIETFCCAASQEMLPPKTSVIIRMGTVSYTHLRAHETVLDLVCRLLLEKK